MAVGARVVTVPATRPAGMLVHQAVCAECQPTFVLFHGRRVAASLAKHPRLLVRNPQKLCDTIFCDCSGRKLGFRARAHARIQNLPRSASPCSTVWLIIFVDLLTYQS